VTGLSDDFEKDTIGKAKRWSRPKDLERSCYHFTVLEDQILVVQELLDRCANLCGITLVEWLTPTSSTNLYIGTSFSLRSDMERLVKSACFPPILKRSIGGGREAIATVDHSDIRMSSPDPVAVFVLKAAGRETQRTSAHGSNAHTIPPCSAATRTTQTCVGKWPAGERHKRV
jgi:hypothetical protein